MKFSIREMRLVAVIEEASRTAFIRRLIAFLVASPLILAPCIATEPREEKEVKSVETVVGQLLRERMRERDVVKSLGVSQVRDLFSAGGLSNRMYMCRCKKLPGQILHLHFVLGKDSWELLDWNLLSAERIAEIEKKSQTHERYRFKSIDDNFVKEQEDLIRHISEEK